MRRAARLLKLFTILALFRMPTAILDSTTADGILARYPGQDDYVSPWSSVSAVAGGSAELPCDLRSPQANDRALLVLWYRSGVVKPVYSYDVRSGVASHWKNAIAVGSRATFHAERSALSLQRVSPKDAATYTCRIDFRSNPTLTYTVNLTVIVPPRRLTITAADGSEVNSIVGPLEEGSALRIKCTAEGGTPSPTVSWWHGDTQLDGSPIHSQQMVTTTVVIEPRTVANTLLLEPLSRNDLHRSLMCKASNTALAAPLTASVSVDMTLSPLYVAILTSPRALSADQNIEVTCQTAGARPPARLSWSLDGKPLSTYTSTASDGTNVTTSVLQWTPAVGDGGKTLECSASLSQAVTADVPLADSWTLVVHYIPRAVLRPGRSLDLSEIEEGDDVYFECSVESSPAVYKIVWLHQGRPLHHNVTAGVILSNQSLVVQGVDRSASGDYTCTASNIEGDGVSNTITLNVKYAPVCQSDQPMYHGAARHEQVNIPCYLEAHPLPHTFTWTFNNSGESVKIPQDHVTVSGAHSTVSYTPMTELDYGTLLCWGTNAVGKQKKPCVYHVFPAGRPDPVSNCSQFNLSATSVSVHCTAGFDGGLPQTFLMELYDGATGHLVANVSKGLPTLSASDLVPGSTFAGVIYSVNAKGRGELLSINAVTIQDKAEKRTAAIKPPPEPSVEASSLLQGSLIAIAAGASTGCLLMVITVVVVMRSIVAGRAAKREERKAQHHVHHGDGSHSPSAAGCSSSGGISYEVADGKLRDSQSSRITDTILADDWLGGARVHTISSSSLASSMATLPRGASLYQTAAQPHYQSCAGDLLLSDALPPSGGRGCSLHRIQQHSSHSCLPTSHGGASVAIPHPHHPPCRASGSLNPNFAYVTLDHRLQRSQHGLPPPPPEFTSSPGDAPLTDPCGVGSGGGSVGGHTTILHASVSGGGGGGGGVVEQLSCPLWSGMSRVTRDERSEGRQPLIPNQHESSV